MWYLGQNTPKFGGAINVQSLNFPYSPLATCAIAGVTERRQEDRPRAASCPARPPGVFLIRLQHSSSGGWLMLCPPQYPHLAPVQLSLLIIFQQNWRMKNFGKTQITLYQLCCYLISYIEPIQSCAGSGKMFVLFKFCNISGHCKLIFIFLVTEIALEYLGWNSILEQRITMVLLSC